MLTLGLWRLDRGGMWRDEAVSFQVGRRSVARIWLLLHDVDAVHGLYYLLLHAVLGLHPGEVVLRLPSVCAAAGTAALVAALGTRLARPRVGLWAGLLYAVTPMAGHYAQEGRSYALVAAGATGATLLFVRAVRGGSWWPYAAVLGLTCWLHEFAVLLLLAHAVSLALARAGARVWRGWGCAGAAVVLALLPMVLVSRAQAAQLAWLREPTAETAEGLLRGFLGPTDEVYGVCLALAVVGLLGLVGRRGEPTCAGVGLPVMVVPPVVLMLVSQLSPLYVDRYVLYALSGAPLVVAAGADRVAGVVGRLRPPGRRVPTRSALRNDHPPTDEPQKRHSAVVRDGRCGEGLAERWSAPAGDDWCGDDSRKRHSALVGDGRCVDEPQKRHSALARDGRCVDEPRKRHSGLVGGRLFGGGGSGGVRRGALAQVSSGTLAGVLAVALSLLHQFPLLQADRDPGRRPDDLAAVSRAAAGEVGPGEPVLFVPTAMRNAALTYPGAFRGTRDVALAAGAAESGTLYGREAGVAELRRRLARLDRVWVVGDRRLLGGRWAPRNPVERAKVTVLWQEFSGREQVVRGGVTVRLYVRSVSDRPRPPSAPPRPERW
ncbi:glycosyltransferase family 39 protein [Streptomyces sp. Caat 7-52]|uniref:glycosyltransferase family 39 protein n=1 Tax=Streptomyces sp. Caat 7-52 TaxID=2949637 RepID=UPI00203641AB|nr:glycosyltransferase family 39 protein [Streptomyces sp. Caat 7-52]